MRKWHIVYAVDAYGVCPIEAETEEQAWETFKEAWYAGRVDLPYQLEDFGELDRNDVTIEEEDDQ